MVDAHSIDTTAGGIVVSARSRDGMGQDSTCVRRLRRLHEGHDHRVACQDIHVGVGYGAKTTVSGRLRSGATGPTPKTVQLKKGGTVVASTTTGGGGAFSFYFLPANVATTYSVAFPGDDAYGASSANVTIKPAAKLSTPSVSPTPSAHTARSRPGRTCIRSTRPERAGRPSTTTGTSGSRAANTATPTTRRASEQTPRTHSATQARATPSLRVKLSRASGA